MGNLICIDVETVARCGATVPSLSNKCHLGNMRRLVGGPFAKPPLRHELVDSGEDRGSGG